MPVSARRGVKEGRERQPQRGVVVVVVGVCPHRTLRQPLPRRLRVPLEPLRPPSGPLAPFVPASPALEVKWRSVLAWTKMTKAWPPRTLQGALCLHCHWEGCKEVI